MLILSDTFGYNLRTSSVVLIISIFIILFLPSKLLCQQSDSGQNNVKLVWTASGDDNFVGQASYYDLRYSTEPVGADTAIWWQSAMRAENMPTPSPANRKDSCFIENLSIYHHYYFAIKVADEAYNWSNIVNIAEIPKVSCADVNGDDAFDYIDLTHLLAFLYNDGPPPAIPGAGDVDNSGNINVADAMYLINYRLNSGPPPNCGD